MLVLLLQANITEVKKTVHTHLKQIVLLLKAKNKGSYGQCTESHRIIRIHKKIISIK